MADDRAVSNMFRVRKTLFKMLRKRGYNVGRAMMEQTLEEFTAELPDGVVRRDQLMLMMTKADDETDGMIVFFPEDESVGVRPVSECCSTLKREGVKNGILVIKGRLTSYARDALEKLSDKFTVEYFTEAELLVDITEHRLVPEHSVLSEDEKMELLARYKLDETQLPRILLTDPVARYYGLKRGQVMRIVRPSETAGRYVTYRIALA
eukprot:PLAT14326.1.p1 GENE.PLAT14326.1~~PLAT14326.1.p1  ORF type:complete len:208 (+),score=95.64 PLAT14326.1:35-658(+)